MANKKQTKATPKKDKGAVRIEKYTKLILKVRRSWGDYLQDAIRGKNALKTTWGSEQEFEFVRKGEFLFMQASECDEVFRIPVSAIKELQEAVE